MKKSIMFFILILTLFSCFNSERTKVVDNYFIGKLGDNNTNWPFFGFSKKSNDGVGIVGQVESAGFNNDFIIIKCSMDKFYIIPYKKNNKPYFDKKILIGPLTKQVFKTRKKELSIERLRFTIFL